jgi:hypothetical protein
VLLLSMTNIAVDNALAKAAAVRPAPGVMIRAGVPHLTDEAQNSAICLQRLVDDRQEALEQELRRLEEQISTLSAEPAIAELAQVEAELEGMFIEVQRQEGDAALATADLDDRFRVVRAEHNAAETARQHITDASDCQRTQDDFKLTIGNAETAISRLEDERDRLTAELAAARTRRRFGHRHLKTLIQENSQQLDVAVTRRNERTERLRNLAPQLARRIEVSLRAALPHTPDSLADLDTRFAESKGRAQDARAASESCARRTRELTTEMKQLRREPGPTAVDSELVSGAMARDLPRKVAERPGLEMRQPTLSVKSTSWKVNTSVSFPGCGGNPLRCAGRSSAAPASSLPPWPRCG